MSFAAYYHCLLLIRASETKLCFIFNSSAPFLWPHGASEALQARLSRASPGRSLIPSDALLGAGWWSIQRGWLLGADLVSGSRANFAS